MTRRGAHRATVATLLALTVLVAGCIAGDDQDDQRGDEDERIDAALVEAFALERLIASHAHHEAHDEHAGMIGFTDAAFVPARESYPDTEAYTELAVKDDHAYLAFGPRGGNLLPDVEAGFFVIDVGNTSAPEIVGKWLGQPLGDIEVSTDGQWAFASTQRNLYPYPWTVHEDAAPDGLLMRGTFLINVADKSAPQTAGFSPLPTNGPHTITYFETPDGRELILQSTYDIVFTAYPDDVGQNVFTQRVVISEFTRSPTPALTPLSQFQIFVEPESEASRFPHDATAFVHPETGRTLMTVAYWDHGMVIVDISDPAQPQEVSRFSDTAPSAYVQTHMVRVFPGLIDGRVVAVMEPEIPNGQDAGQFTFVDITDPAAPGKLGHWTIPGDLVIDEPFKFSPHNFDPVCAGNGQPLATAAHYTQECVGPMVVASHFHGGLWVLDARDPTDPQTRAFFFPEVNRTNVPEGFPWTGSMSVFAKDGHLFAPETQTGLWVLPLPELHEPTSSDDTAQASASGP